MNAEYYSDNSIAIFGDTKPWKENLKMLGASYNPHLKGPEGIRVGWIIPITKKTKLCNLLTMPIKVEYSHYLSNPKPPNYLKSIHQKPQKSQKPQLQNAQPQNSQSQNHQLQKQCFQCNPLQYFIPIYLQELII